MSHKIILERGGEFRPDALQQQVVLIRIGAKPPITIRAVLKISALLDHRWGGPKSAARIPFTKRLG